MTTTMMRAMILLAVMMAAIVVLSGPVAGVLDLPEPTAEAKKKKKKKKRPPASPAFNVVMCATNPCNGTSANDYLLGTNEGAEDIYGGEGNDVYDGKGGWDKWHDSTTSNDTYLVGKIEAPFEAASINDDGGSSDTVDLRPYSSTDLSSGTGSYQEAMFIYIDGHHMAEINNQESSPIEYFRFADKTLTALQMEALYG